MKDEGVESISQIKVAVATIAINRWVAVFPRIGHLQQREEPQSICRSVSEWILEAGNSGWYHSLAESRSRWSSTRKQLCWCC